jgi:hypothetical protein
MLSEDYIMRMIGQATAVLLKIIGLKKNGDYPEAQQAIDQALEKLIGLKAEIIKQLDNESLLNTLTHEGKLDIDRLALIADLFKEDGDIFAALGRVSESRESYLRSLIFHLETGFDETAQPSDDLTKKIEELVQKLGYQNLPDEPLWTLFCYYELTGAFPKADEALLKLAERPGLYADIQPELVAFYKRLLEKPAGELSESGMNREEVMGKLEQAKQNYNEI